MKALQMKNLTPLFFSKDSLTINVEGSLTITGGTINVTSDGDALDSNNAEEDGCGYIHISSGNLTLKSEGKGIKAQSLIYIAGGTIDINSTSYIGGTISNGEMLGTYTQDSIIYGSGMGGMGDGPGGRPDGGMGGPGGHGNWR